MLYAFNTISIFLLMSTLLVACNRDAEKTQSVVQGEQLFKGNRIGFVQAPGCILCHSLKKGIRTAGPSLYAIGERANHIKENMSAKQYIYESIVNPAAYVVDGYRHDLMYPHYENDLETAEINALVDFLITLK